MSTTTTRCDESVTVTLTASGGDYGERDGDGRRCQSMMMTPLNLVVDPGSLQIAESTSSGTASFDVKPWRHEPSGRECR